jgi:serpin B
MTRLMTAIMLALLAFSGCRNEEQLKPLAGGQADDAATSVNEFAVDLYRQLAIEDGNLFFSPASISTALAMTWVGAGGQTALEAASVLHLNSDREKVLADYSQLLGGLAGSDSTYTLNVANRLWGQKDFSFNKSYLERIQSCFGGGFQSVDFKSHPDEERLAINQWVARRTEDKIQNLLPAGTVNQDTRLILTNAVYFLGDWLFPFPKNRTKDVDFHLADGSIKSTPTMKLDKNLPYFSDDSLAMVALPYVGDDLEFLVILPHLKNGLPKIEAELNSASLEKNIQALSPKKVDVWLPRLDLSQDFNLGDILKRLGMKQAFSPSEADFSGMSDQGELFISSVVHKSFLKVDEQGTEAAAATGVTIGVTSMPSPPTMFVADHPFLFLIRQKDTGVILFMGRYKNPLM